jgi:hypothetical protein
MHNERCTSGSARGRAKPAVARPPRRARPTQPYVATWRGAVFVAFVIDAFSRMIRVSTSMKTDFVLDALEQALHARSDITGDPSQRPRIARGFPAVVATSQYWRCWMGRPRGWVTERTGRAPMRSPGRPGVNQRETKQAFWVRIAAGASSEDAALASGVSQPLGPRWFREAGGMRPINLVAHSGLPA